MQRVRIPSEYCASGTEGLAPPESKDWGKWSRIPRESLDISAAPRFAVTGHWWARSSGTGVPVRAWKFESSSRRFYRNVRLKCVANVVSNMDRECNECGSTDWKTLDSRGYPERRNERNQTIKTVYRCQSCGAQGRHFEHNHEGTEIFSAAMR